MFSHPPAQVGFFPERGLCPLSGLSPGVPRDPLRRCSRGIACEGAPRLVEARERPRAAQPERVIGPLANYRACSERMCRTRSQRSCCVSSFWKAGMPAPTVVAPKPLVMLP